MLKWSGPAVVLLGLVGITFSLPDITAMVVALTALVTVVGTQIINFMAARAVKVAIAKTAETTAIKIEEVKMAAAADTKVIAEKIEAVTVLADESVKLATKTEGHVNSAASVAKTQIEGLQNELRLMREERANDKERMAVAEARTPAPTVVVLTTPAAAAAVVPVMDGAVGSLNNIDENTKETAINTARTEAGVQELKDKP